MKAIRPQIFLALLGLVLVTGMSLWTNNIEVATAAIGGMIAVVMKMMENE